MHCTRPVGFTAASMLDTSWSVRRASCCASTRSTMRQQAPVKTGSRSRDSDDSTIVDDRVHELVRFPSTLVRNAQLARRFERLEGLQCLLGPLDRETVHVRHDVTRLQINALPERPIVKRRNTKTAEFTGREDRPFIELHVLKHRAEALRHCGMHG